MNSRTRTYILEVAAFVALCLLFFFYGLGNFGLVGADEPRYAQIAREMLRNNDYVTPTLHGSPWLEKPALYYWRAAAAFHTFGVHDWVARLPSASFALVLIIIIYFHMRRFRPGAHFGAAIITASAAAMIGFARGASTDMQLAAPFSFAMLGWYAWYETGRKFWLFDLYFFIGVGMLAKGPVAPGLAFLVVSVFAAVRRDLKLIWRTLWWPGVLIFLAIVSPWYIAVQRANPDFFRIFILQHNLERFATDLFQHRQPFWFYLPVFALSLMPWTVFAFTALVSGAKQTWRDWRLSAPGIARESERVGDAFPEFLVIWALLPVVFFSFSQSKLPGYILPSIPPAAILTGDYLYRRREKAVRIGLLSLHAVLTGLLMTAVLLTPLLVLNPKQVPPVSTMAYALLFGVAAALLIFFLTRRGGQRMLLWSTIIPTALGVFFLLHFGGWALDAAYSSREVATVIEKAEQQQSRQPSPPVAVFQTRRDVEYGLGFYLDEPIERYERGEVPETAHIVVTTEAARNQLAARLPGRKIAFIGEPTEKPRSLRQDGIVNPQKLEVYWISSSNLPSR
jgi:4-amino-4-deoxy-L-arabinose transferase-like glycosyltransferase